MVLAPHPDDETLGAGGLIAKLRAQQVAVHVAAVTDGEGAYEDSADLDSIRTLEQAIALDRLGVSEEMIYRLHLPDRDVEKHEDKLVELLLQLTSKGMHLVAPWPGDFHPDHEATGRAAARVAKMLDLPLTFYLFWTWHRGTVAELEGEDLVLLSLSKEELATKLHALDAHVSQFEHHDGQPILSRELLAPAHRNFEVFIK